jgi:hypothetical protein
LIDIIASSGAITYGTAMYDKEQFGEPFIGRRVTDAFPK